MTSPTHTALSVKQFLAEKSIVVLAHFAQSPDLVPCGFFLFPAMNNRLKEAS
jgi:hypothetical protein